MSARRVTPIASRNSIPMNIKPVLDALDIKAAGGYFTTDIVGRAAFTAWDAEGEPIAVLIRDGKSWVPKEQVKDDIHSRLAAIRAMAARPGGRRRARRR